MVFVPKDGSELRDLAFNKPEDEDKAFGVVLDMIDQVCADSKNMDPASLKDITERGSIEANFANIKTAIESRKLMGEVRQFRIASEVQKQFWEATNDKKIIIPEFPHHENIIWSGKEEKWVPKGELGLIVAPLSYTFGPVVTNPHSFDKTPQENIEFVADTDRVIDMIETMAMRFDIDPNEIAEAGSVYCNNVVGKRAWSIVNQGGVAPDQVGPEHFIAVDRAIRATGYGMKFG